MTEYVIPLLEAKVGDYEMIMRMEFVRVIEVSRALNTYNQLKNYESFVEFEIKKNPDEAADQRSKFNLPNADKAPFRWSDWEIKNAWEYDLMVVPTLGDAGWSKMMQRPNVTAHSRLS